MAQKKKKSKLSADFITAVAWSFRLAWKTSRQLFATIVGCFLLEAVIPVASTAALGVLVAKLKDVGPQSPASFKVLVLWLSLAIGLLAFEFVLSEIRTLSRKRLIDETGVNLQKELYLHTARMDLSFFEGSEALNRLFRASAGGGGGAVGPIQSTLAGAAAIIQIVSLFGLMFYLQPLMATLLFLAGIPLLAMRSFSAVQRYQLDIRTTQRRRLGRYYTSRLAGEENVPAIKLLNLAAEIINRFEETARSIILARREILEKISLRLGFTILFYMVVLLAVITWLTYNFCQGTIAVGVLVTFSLAAFRALKSNTQLSNALALGAESSLAIVPLLDFLTVEPEISDKGGIVPAAFNGRIDLEDVSFSYPHSNMVVLKELTLSILPGQTVAIVGRNGAGKTTLIKLIARFYEVDQGRIRIDDIDLKELSLRWLHDHIAMVFQKPTRFEATVHDNIAFGDWQKLKDAPDEVCRLAVKTGLKSFIERLPQGFKTHLGRLFGNETLSAGQWQLLAITRAMARNEAILILDEPTSNLDMASEASMFQALKELATKRTVIFISHKLSTVKEADRILVLDEGRLVEDGSHAELVAREGFYADMVKSQKSEVFLQ